MLFYCFLRKSRGNENSITAKSVIKLSQGFDIIIHQKKRKEYITHTLNNTSVYFLTVDREQAAIKTEVTLYGGVYMLSHFSRVLLLVPQWTIPGRLPCPWDLQARTRAWVAMPSSRGSSWHRDGTWVSCGSCTAGGLFTTQSPGQPLEWYIVG